MSQVHPIHGVEDPLDAASNPQLPPREVYGQIDIDAWFCALVKGVGKVPYDFTVHDRRSTALDITIIPLAESKMTNPFKRSLIAESTEWAKIGWPSIQRAGVAAKLWAKETDAKLNLVVGKWCKMQLVPDGRTYVGKDGDTRESMTFKFLELYVTEEQCITAYHNRFSTDDQGNGTGQPPPAPGGSPSPAAQPTPDAQPAANKERETAFEFLRVLARAANGNKDLLATQIAGMPMIAKYFNMNSPEVQQLLQQAA